MDVDFNKLIETNNICKSWSQRFKTAVNSYHTFVADLRNNPDKYLSQLSGSERQQLRHDLKVMFYALQVENELIVKFRPMIFHICKRLRIENTKAVDLIDEAYAHGLMALRYSVWLYSKPVCSFNTYAFNGIMSALRGFLSHIKKCRNSFKYKVESKMSSLNFVSKEGEKFEFYVASAELPPEQKLMISENEITWDIIRKKANLDKEEQILLTYYMEKRNIPENCGWRKKYLRSYIARKGKKISVSTINERLNRIKNRIRNAVIGIKGEEYANQYCVGA